MSDNALILSNARLVGDPGGTDATYCLHVENGRIAKMFVGPVAETGSACVMDLGGRWMMPGLIDCHTHPVLADANISRLAEVPVSLMTARAANILNRMLMRGFTTIRDAAGADWGLKQAVEDGEIVGPRMFISGRALSQTGGHGDFLPRVHEDPVSCACSHALAMTSRIADGVDALRQATRQELRRGANQIKIMVSGGVSSPNDPLECDQYSPAEIAVVVEEAERRGTYVMAHAYSASAIKRALGAGVRSIEHGNFIDREAADLAAEKGAFVVPTLVTYDALKHKAPASGWSAAMLDKLDRVRERGLASIEICCAAGVQIGFGTDLLGDDFDRQCDEFEIRSSVQSAADVLNSATVVGAKLLQKEGELGVLKPGAIADVLVLDANPLENMSVFNDSGSRIRLILKDGRVVKNDLALPRGVQVT